MAYLFRDSARSSVAVCWQARKLATSVPENMVSIAYTGKSILDQLKRWILLRF